MKQTPKSCSCRSCRRGKSRPRGNAFMRFDERAFRHAAKIRLNRGSEVIAVAPAGNYFG